MDTGKLIRITIGALLALVVLVLGWRSDPVQQTLRPERYWTNKLLLIELDVDNLRNRVADCAAAALKMEGGVADAAKTIAEPASRSETVAKLCSSYDEDLKAAVESLLAVKKKLKDARG